MTDHRPNVTQKQTPPMIRDRKGFKAHALTARVVDSLGAHETGGNLRGLAGADLDQFILDCEFIDYCVWSYSTPIAWHWTATDGTEGWHKVEQQFSPTTGKHQSRLYLIPVDQPFTHPPVVAAAKQGETVTMDEM